MRPSDISLDNCLKCSDCNAVCPVMTAHPAFPGPKNLGPELEKLRREGLPCDSDWLEYCLSCERCSMACPNGVHVAELITAAKGRHHKPPVRRLRDEILSRPGLLGKMMAIVPMVGNWALALKPMRKVMSLTIGMARERTFPAYGRPTVAAMAANMPAPAVIPHPMAGDTGGDTGISPVPVVDRVVLFEGCSMRYNEQELGRACLDVLHANGLSVEVSRATCCGYPALANGVAGEARREVRANLDLLIDAAEKGIPIVTACTSCSQMLKTGFTSLLGDDPLLAAKAKLVESMIRDLGEFLMERAEQGLLSDALGALSHGHLAYHAPCHQMTQGLARPWFHLLQLIPGMDIEDLNAGCCGMAGTFGFKQEKYPVSMAIGQRLFDAIERAHPDLVVSECPTCRMQITHGSGVPAVHPLSLLKESYENGRKNIAA